MFNFGIAKFEIIGEQIYDELNHFIDALRGGESIGFRGTINYDRANSLALCREHCLERRRTIGTKLWRLVKRPISMSR